jgi:hypothetical protein
MPFEFSIEVLLTPQHFELQPSDDHNNDEQYPQHRPIKVQPGLFPRSLSLDVRSKKKGNTREEKKGC